ncbi:Trypsin-like peptidase domain-containing protein [Pseudomonas sp. NFACC09-4]|uniref:S1 family peptidase n=1 Tax=Pseudomonas sp. NFACC09-4 TaxID=1566237 RepID=UPI0009090532|nr:serine protease [Pseudomonas sp. NFACC09-4]SFW61095.1 Trypsin-like peptidase domain-containing protein [Pseudomonas sp. NFACC09-4]
MALSIAEQMFYSTVKLSTLQRGLSIGTGTGFFFSFAINGEEQYAPAIVTNNHVIQGGDAIVATFHLSEEHNPSGKHVARTIPLQDDRVIRHPDPNIDLCAILVTDTINQAIAENKPLFFVDLDQSIIPMPDDWQHYDAIEEVTMIGYPRGISDTVNNLPISRKGITASSLAKSYNGRQEFMVDMACFPGSSGSPIFVHDRNSYLDRKTKAHVMGHDRVKLVGILYAGPLITNKGNIILGETPQIEVAAMMHLGNAIKSSELLVLDKIIRLKVYNQPPT